MKIVAISDVHIKKPRDSSDKFLMSFFEHPETQSADYILLLGDIFDLMCGPHNEYLRDYSHIFDKIDEFLRQNKKILYFEGNHDVHLAQLFLKKWPKQEIVPYQYPLVERIENKNYYFSHGDEHELDNLSYQRYKKFILTKPMRFVANRLVPYIVLNFFGERASDISRKKGKRVFNHEDTRNKFREGVEKNSKSCDFVLGGHSHVQDLYKIPGSSCIYINNGYAQSSKTFILIEDHVPSFVNLE